MNKPICLSTCFVLTILLFSCKNHPAPITKAELVADTLQIEKVIRQKGTRTYTVLSDTVKNTPSKLNPSPYFSFTNFYFDSTTKQLYKAENILQATNKALFTAYYDKDNIIKTEAQTEFGWYSYYFSASEQVDKTGNYINKPEDGYRKMFLLQCLKLAKEQLSAFRNKIGRNKLNIIRSDTAA